MRSDTMRSDTTMVRQVVDTILLVTWDYKHSYGTVVEFECLKLETHYQIWGGKKAKVGGGV